MRHSLYTTLLLVLAINAVADEAEDDEFKRFFENKIPAEVEAALVEADEIVLQSISPKHKLNVFEREPGPGDYPVFGEVKLGKRDRSRVAAAFRAAAADQAEANK